MRKSLNCRVKVTGREKRRNRADFLEVFKMYTGWSTISFDSMFTLNTGVEARDHYAEILKSAT